MVAGGGNVNQGFGTVQYGGGLGKSTDYRIFAKYFNQDHRPALNVGIGGDGWHVLRGGFRADSRYTGREGTPGAFYPSITSSRSESINTVVPVSGGFVHTVWNHVYSARSSTTFLISFDHYKRNDQVLAETRNTLDVEFQHPIAWGTRQDIVWGANYRNTDSESQGSLLFSLHPANVNMQLFSLFVQDQIAPVPEKLYLTVGTKLDHNNYTNFNSLPSARVAWTPATRHMFWAAISRADRTPSEIDTASRINFAGFPGPGGIPTLVAVVGNPHFDDENLTAYETGDRTTLLPSLSIDLAAYYNRYDHQQTTEPATPFIEISPAPAHLVLPVTCLNLMHGEARGLEVAVTEGLSMSAA